MSKRAFSEIRDVIITFDDGTATQEAMGIDAYKAAIGKVEEIESAYYNDSSLADFADKLIVFTGTSRYKLYSFQLTTTLADGKYEFIWNETVPNVDNLSE